MGLKLVFCVLVLATTTLAWPWQTTEERCGKTCKNMSGYELNKKYTYDYSITVSSLINGTSDEDSSVVVTCNANIEVVDNCEMVLTVSQVQIQEKNSEGSLTISKSNNFLRSELMSKELHFSYDEGLIQTLCPEDEEKSWVLNFKRGVLSAFQGTSLQVLSMEPEGQTTSMETDVTGICPVDLKKVDEGVTVKSKDFMGCQKRGEIDSSVQAIQLLPHAPTMSVLNSTQICEQQWTSQRLQRTLCREKHLVKPFSKGESGAVTTVVQIMEISNIVNVPQRSDSQINRKTDLLFEHIVKEDSIDAQELEATLQEVCDNIDSDIGADAAERFAKVAFQMRKLEKASLAGVVSKVMNNEICGDSASLRRFVIDALPVCESTACVGVMTDLIRSEAVEQKLIDTWIMSFAFLRHPSVDMVNDLTNLLRDRDDDKALYLSLSALIHQFCSENENCLDYTPVPTALEFFEQTLGFDCNANTDEKKFKVMLALKALGNSGQAVSVIPTLDRCFEQKLNPIGVRIAAMEALRRIPCEKGNRDIMLNMYKDKKEDSEIRIEAFRGAMKCLDANMIQKVIEQMEIEKSDQVGSYVWSFLKNLNTTSDPLKQDHRAIVQESGALKRFRMDPRKFSRNMELSFFNDTTGFGATLESDVIFSSQSFIPRQVSVDSKIDLFGFSIDLLEIGGRVEGIQYFLESMAGPDGLLKENGIMDLLMAPERRQKRATIRDSTLNNLLDNLDIQAEDKLQGSVYWKIFGNELGFADLAKLKDFNLQNPSTAMLQFVMELAKEKVMEYSKNMMLLEITTFVPSCAGVPIKISVNGSASVQLKTSGKMDVRQLMVAPRSLDITGKIEPSATVEVSTIMETDFFVARTGVKHVARAYTSTSLEGSVVLANGKAFNLNLKVPERRLNIADVKSNLYLIRMEEEMEIQGNPDTQMDLNLCTGSDIEQYFGVALCAEANFPSSIMKPNGPRFPLSGNVDVEIYLEKRDVSLTEYRMEASYKKKQTAINDEVFVTDIVHFMVGTPGTTILRTYSLDMTLNRADKNLTIDMVTPTKTASLSADLVKDELMQQLEVLFFIDDAQVMKTFYSLNIQPDKENQRVKFSPIVTFEYNCQQETKSFSLSGSVTKDLGQKRTEIDLVFNKPSENLITLSGNVQKNIGEEKTSYVTDLNLGGRYITARIDGEIVKKGNKLTSSATIEYVPRNQDSRTMNFAMKLTNKTNDEFREYEFMTSMSFSQNPKFDFRIDSNTKFNAMQSESSHRLCYSNIDCQGDKFIALEHNFELAKSENNIQNDLQLNLRIPALEKNFQITQSLTRNFDKPLDIVIDLEEIVSTTLLFHTKLNLNSEGTETLPRGSLVFELSCPLREGKFTQTWQRVSENKVTATTTLKTEADKVSSMAITWEKIVKEDDDTYKKHSIDIGITTPDETEVDIEYYIELTNGEMTTELTTRKNQERIVFTKLELDDLSDSQKLKKELTFTCNIPVLESLKDVTWASEFEYKNQTLFSFESTLTVLQNKFIFSTNLRNKTTDDKKHGEFSIRFETPENQFEVFSSAKQRGKLTSFETSVTFTPGNEDGKTFAVKLDHTNKTNEMTKEHQVIFALEAPDQRVSSDFMFSCAEGALTSVLSVTYAPEKTIRNSLVLNTRNTETEKVLDFEMTTTTPERSFGLVFNNSIARNRVNPHLEISLTTGNVFTTDLVYETKKNGAIKDIVWMFDLPEEENDVKLRTILSKTPSGVGFEFTVTQADAETMQLNFDMVPMITESDKQFDIALNIANTYITGYDVNFDLVFARLNRGASNLFGANITVDGDRKIEFETSMKTLYANQYRKKVQYLFKNRLPQVTEAPLRNMIFNFTYETENEDISQYISFLYGDLSEDYKICMEHTNTDQYLGKNHNIHNVVHLRHPFVVPNIPQDMAMDIRSVINAIETTSTIMFVRNDLTTTVTTRYRNKTNDNKIHHMSEIIISRPDKHDITIKGVGKLFDGNTMFSTDIDVTYSSDKTKAISFSFDLTNNTNVEYTSDYTMGMEVLHLFSNVDVTLACSFTNNTERGSFGLESQIAIDDDYIPIAFEGEFNKLSQKYEIHTNGPVREMWFRGQIITISDGHYRLDMTNQYDDKVIPSYFELDMISRQIEYKLMFEEEGDDYWKIVMGYYNDTALEADLTRMIQGQLTNDAHMRVVLTSPKVLRNEIHWRPEWIEEINATISNKIERINRSLAGRSSDMKSRMDKFRRRLYDSMMDFVQENDEYKQMLNEIKRDLATKLFVFKSKMSSRIIQINENIKTMKEDIALQIMPSLMKINSTLRELKSEIQELKEDLKMKIQLWTQNALVSLESYKAQFDGRMIGEFKAFGESYKMKMASDVELIKQELTNATIEIMIREKIHFETLKLNIQAKKEIIREMFENFIVNIKGAFRERFDEMKLNFEDSTFYNDLMIFVEGVKNNELASDIMESVAQSMNEIQNSEDLFLLKNLLTELREYRRAQANNTKNCIATSLMEKVKGFIILRYEDLKEQMYAKAQEYNSSTYLLEKLDIENGEIIFLLFLEEEWQTLTQWPEVYTQGEKMDEYEGYQSSVYRRLGGYKNNLLAKAAAQREMLFSDTYLQSLKEQWGSDSLNEYVDQYIQQSTEVWSWFYMVKRLIQPKNLIPPYQAYAMMMGTEHFTTFDKSYFDFSNKCSYILASDFIDGNFSVIVDYDRAENTDSRSIVVKVDDQTIEITSDWQVKKNDRVIDLPIQFEKTTIIRDNGIIRVDNTNGVTVRCNLYSEYCTVNVTGWYFGKTRGLFGTYNYEKNDDMTKSNGRVTDNVPEFARSWQVGRKCNDHDNDAKRCDANPKLESNQRCAELFLDFRSEFSRCFTEVDQNMFYKMCVNQKCGLSLSHDIASAICNVSNAYREQCRQQEVMLKPLRECVMCKGSENQDFYKNERERLEEDDDKPQSADIIFVVEEKLCAQEVVKRLPDLADSLNTELKKKGMKENRFGLVGFGGPNIHDIPHMHTIDHQIFNHQRKLQLGIDSLEFGEGGNNDTFKALEKAANYPFRAGVAKNIILISCSQCKDSKMTYMRISRTIIKRGINFNILMNYNFTGKAGKDVSVYGIDERFAFTRKSSSGQLGDADLRRRIKEPTSKCAILALESNGTIFDMQSINDKKFIDVFTQRMLQTTMPMECQVCKCVADKEGSGISICEKCFNPLIKSPYRPITDMQVYISEKVKPQKPNKKANISKQ
ncbi:apolipophorins-like [Antedon mediterranea]|uniref:apolipophorins-like n=1 Tax=Antedon mediterranea TaxID=105859 RepID=UPI003AF42FCA